MVKDGRYYVVILLDFRVLTNWAKSGPVKQFNNGLLILGIVIVKLTVEFR